MKKKYQQPSSQELLVFLEDGFTAASVFEPEKANEGVSIEGHEVGSDFDYSIGDENVWD